MKITSQLTDDVLMRELGSRLADARIERDMTQAALAVEAGISKRTVERLESGEVAAQLSSFLRVCRVLGLIDRFETLLPAPSLSPMAQLNQKGRRRQRATSRKDGDDESVDPAKPWAWGESS